MVIQEILQLRMYSGNAPACTKGTAQTWASLMLEDVGQPSLVLFSCLLSVDRTYFNLPHQRNCKHALLHTISGCSDGGTCRGDGDVRNFAYGNFAYTVIAVIRNVEIPRFVHENTRRIVQLGPNCRKTVTAETTS